MIKSRFLNRFCCFFLAIIAFFMCLSLFFCNNKKIAANAESQYISDSQYAGANLLSVNTLFVESSVKFVNDNGAYKVVSTTSSSLVKYVAFRVSLNADTVYTVSLSDMNSHFLRLALYSYNENGSYVGSGFRGDLVKYGIYDNFTFSPSTDIDYAFVFYLANGTVVGQGSPMYIMLNVGSSVQPYLPNLNDIYLQGLDLGYNQGVEDTKDNLQLGIFRDCTLSVSGSWTEDGVNSLGDFAFNLSPDYNYQSISMRNIATYLDYYNDYDFLTAEFTLHFAEPFYFNSFPLYFVGSSVFYDLTFNTAEKFYIAYVDHTTSAGTAPNGDTLLSSLNPIYINDSSVDVSTLLISSLSFEISNIDVLYEMGFYSPTNTGYLNGYSVGYNEGSSHGRELGYSSGRVDGYHDGSIDGYNEGYAVATSENGFLHLLSAVVDAPIKAFTGLLDFEIMGVNLRSFYLSMFTLGAFLFILRFFF